MKLTRLLHPEIVQARRGPKPLIKLYKQIYSKFDFSSGKVFSQPADLKSFFDGYFPHLNLAAKARYGCQTYYVGRDFTEALKDISFDIPIELLPTKFFAFIAFPEKTVFDKDGDEVEGCYVFIGDANAVGLAPEYWGQNAISVCYSTKSTNQDELPITGFFTETLSDAKNVLGLINGIFGYTVDNEGTIVRGGDNQSELWRLVFNIVLYIHSPYQDVLPLRPKQDLRKEEFQEQTLRAQVENLCTIPVKLLSWNFCRPTVFHKDSTWVRPFLRWQRCGVGNTDLKLVWVKGHDRKFQNYLPLHS